MEFPHHAMDLGMSGTLRSPCESGGGGGKSTKGRRPSTTLPRLGLPHVLSVCLFVCLPAARGTHGPSSSTAAASSSPPRTSSGGPLRCHFAIGGFGGDQDKQETIAVASNEGRHERDRKYGSRGGGRGKYCCDWSIRGLCVSWSRDGMIETGINLQRTRGAVM